MEEEEEVKPKVVPLSLEELLAKRKAEQEALSKVRTMNDSFRFSSGRSKISQTGGGAHQSLGLRLKAIIWRDFY